MRLFQQRSFEPRSAEICAAEAELVDEPFLPNNLDVLVLYGGHSERKDFKKLEPFLRDADIFVPEFTYWKIEEIELFSRISQGDKSARTELERGLGGGGFNGFTAAETKWLLGSGVYVTPIDYAAHHEGADRILNHFENWGLLDKLVPSFDKSLIAIDRFAREEGRIEDYRESIMLRSVGSRLKTLIDNSPDLAVKDRIKVVVQQGTAHTFFYHQLKKLVDDNPTCTSARMVLESKPFIFEHFDRLTRAHRAGIELTKEERKELAIRSLARTGLRLFNRGGIPLVIYPGESLLRPVPPDEMADRIDISTVQDFHRRVIEARTR